MSDESDAAQKLVRELDARIEDWFVETMHNSPVSRVVEIYNHVRVAVDALKQRIKLLSREL